MRVVIVDDDAVSRMALAHVIRDLGEPDILELDSASEAWNCITDDVVPVLMCCDVRMRGMSGVELLSRVKSSPVLEEIPVVIVSSVADRETVQQSVKLGASGYILKPFVFGVGNKLQGILASTWAKFSETPQQTMRRLNIGPDRLRAYLRAFLVEVTNVSELCCERRADGGCLVPSDRLDRLRTGCLTLGLWRASRVMELLGGTGIDSGSMLLGLEHVRSVANHQLAKLG